MAEIVVDAVTKRWNATRAVDGVSFTAAAGEFLVLLGPSGCGKSTTLRLIAGLELADAGRISIGGRDVSDLSPAMRGVSMVFQSYALFPHLNVAENILFGLRVRKVPAAERQRRLGRAADLLGLSQLLKRRPSELSGGQQQRVALGRAIVAETKVCLMDEPLSNLDAQLRHEMRRELHTLQRKLGVTMVYVTHDQTEAMTMADRVIVMREGRIEQDAPPAVLYARPASAFVARFIGTPPMNILRLADGRGGAVVQGLDGPQILRRAGAGLLLGVRPEDVRIIQGSGVPARVVAIEYLGADSIVTCLVGEETIAIRTPGQASHPVGARVALGWASEAAHAFDADSGARRNDIAFDMAAAAGGGG